MHLKALGLAAGAAALSLATPALAADDADIGTVIDAPADGVDSAVVDDPKVDVVIDDGAVDFTRGGDDGVIEPTERTLPGELDNPEIIYTMAGPGGVEMADGAADQAAEQAAEAAADRVVDQVGATAAAAPAVAGDPE